MNKFKQITIAAMLGVGAIPAASAELVFSYHSPSVGLPSNDGPVDPSCYTQDPGTVGEYAGCYGMLIVDGSMLASAASSDSNYSITHDGEIYTLGDSDKNVFTGQVKNFDSLFKDDCTFNEPIGYWDTSSATTMDETFSRACFDQDIGSWDVRDVSTFIETFYRNDAFNQDLSGWCPESYMSNKYYAWSTNAWTKPKVDWNLGGCDDES